MVVYYPGAVAPFTTKIDLVDHVVAADVNNLQSEVAALETFVGLNPHVSTAPNPASTFTQTSTTYASLAARLANIEIGVVSDAHIQYVRNTGGAVVTTSSNSVIPLTISAKGGQTADILRVTGVGGTPVYLNVDSTGVLYNNTKAIPLGRISSAKVTSNIGPFTGEVQLFALQQSFTAVAGRKYRVGLDISLVDNANTASGYTLRLHETNAAGVLYRSSQRGTIIPTTGFGSLNVNQTWMMDDLSAGAHVLVATVQGLNGANLLQVAGTAFPAYMWVEDIGT